MYFLAFLAAAGIVNAQSTLPVGIDPRCKKMDAAQWDAFPKKDVIRQRAFAGLGLPADRAFTEVLFGHETKTELNGNWFCAEGWNTVFQPATELQCDATTVNLIDKSSNAPGVVTINVQSGTTASTTITETDSSATADEVSMKMSGNILLIGGVEAAVSFTETFTKTLGKAQTFQTNTLTSISRQINIGSSSSNCTATLTQKTCQHQAEGKYPIIALGWVGWRLKDEYTYNGEKARRWYVFIDNFPREDREGWGTINAGISSQTYATVISECETTGKRHARLTRSDRVLRGLHASLRAEVPTDADELQTAEDKLARAKAALPDKLKGKVMNVGDHLFLPVGDDD